MMIDINTERAYGEMLDLQNSIEYLNHDENRIIPVSTLLEGEYGETDVYAGVPTILNRTGAADVLEIHMTPGELARFKESIAVIRENTNKLMEVHMAL